MLDDLPTDCDVGMKKDSKGYKSTWVGYKLHIDVADGQIPISCLLTSASLHDSQAAIPLATLSAERTTNLYDLMDAAYDAEPIRQHSRSLGHVPLIDTNPRRNKALAEELRTEARRLKNLGFQLAEQVRYNERTAGERPSMAWFKFRQSGGRQRPSSPRSRESPDAPPRRSAALALAGFGSQPDVGVGDCCPAHQPATRPSASTDRRQAPTEHDHDAQDGNTTKRPLPFSSHLGVPPVLQCGRPVAAIQGKWRVHARRQVQGWDPSRKPWEFRSSLSHA